jgi:hypothetical protein
MGCSICYKDVTPNPRDKKNAKVSVEMLSEHRFLVSFKQHSYKKKEKERIHLNQTTRENTKMFCDDTEADDKLISGFLKSDANAMYDDLQKTQNITTRRSLTTEYDNSEVKQIDDWNPQNPKTPKPHTSQAGLKPNTHEL